MVSCDHVRILLFIYIYNILYTDTCVVIILYFFFFRFVNKDRYNSRISTKYKIHYNILFKGMDYHLVVLTYTHT